MYESITVLAAQLGVRTVMPVGNKVANTTEEEFLRREVEASGHKLFASIPYDASVVGAEMSRTALLEFAPNSPSVKAIDSLKQTLVETYATSRELLNPLEHVSGAFADNQSEML